MNVVLAGADKQWLHMEIEKKEHTCYCSDMVNLFGVDQENNIALRRVHIGILEQKHSVYAIFL